MAVRPFATNNLVKEHVLYREFILKKWNDVSENGVENTDKLFWKKGCLDGIKVPDVIGNPYKSLQKMHCMVSAYDIWCDCVKDCVIWESSIDSKKRVHVTDDILKKFKYRFEQTVKNAGCNTNKLDACRYLAMAWTYLDLTNATNQRYFPDKETAQKAAKMFGYKDDENPFIMNGKFWKWEKRKEKKPMEMNKEKQNVDIGTVTLEDLDFSVRTHNCLKRKHCDMLIDIAKLSYHDLCRNLGRNNICEIVAKLREYGLKPNNEETPQWVIDKIGPDPEETVIDIAEQAAKEIEEENMVHLDDYNALLKKYNELSTMYDKLLNQRMELDSYNLSLREEIENLKDSIAEHKNREMKLNIAADPKNFDTFTLLDTVLKKMKDSKMEYILVTINGMVIDIRPKQDVPIGSTTYQIRTSEVR